MRHRRRLTLALVSIAAGATGAAFGAPALAADPPGANGTVKIDGAPYQHHNNNEPHVTCEFRVEFFDFDKDERATMIFTAQPPSSADFHEVGRLENQLVSNDAASGGSVKRDEDAYFQFTAGDLDLTDADLHRNQGYHIKLTIDRKNHPEWTEKHKVFWLEPCESRPSSPPPNGNGGNGGNGNGGNGNGGGGGELPITGPAIGGLVALGAALVAGGAGLLFVRRRKEDAAR
jgi:LPXTG-motif cell wall-anchored protein